MITLVSGVDLALIDIFYKINTLIQNMIKPMSILIIGLSLIGLYYSHYFNLTFHTGILSVGIGVLCIILHLLIAKGMKLKLKDINKGLLKTSLLIYGLELPSEEVLYRGILLIPLLTLINPRIAILLSTLLFLLLHLKT